MKRKISEWISVQVVKKPGQVVLGAILLFNIVFFTFAAAIISALSYGSSAQMGFVEAAFCTITMILDAGCIQFVVADFSTAGVAITVFCLAVVVIGMISFTGAVIGYVTNYISHFIENANTGKRKLRVSDHFVILNWNTRASEIINDLLYCHGKQTVVVLVNSRKEEIEKEIEERISDTIRVENQRLHDECKSMPFFARNIALFKHSMKRNVTVVVREGDVFSSKQLYDISLERARAVIILGSDINNTLCKMEYMERLEEASKGNSQTVKTLMQVADITGSESSNDDQRIIVEITDDWTWDLVDKIIRYKEVKGKCNIVPVRVNKILGQILSQFSLMPELNMVYQELFSNKGSAFYSVEQPMDDDIDFASRYLTEHKYALPLTFMDNGEKIHCYYAAGDEKDIDKISPVTGIGDYTVALNADYWMEKKHVIILGHNSKIKDIMCGFSAFCGEWNLHDEQIVDIAVIDDKKNLDKMNWYEEYPFVTEKIDADIFDRERICDAIERIVSAHEGDTSILILSDDTALNEDIDANALANLVYVQDIINKKKALNPDFDVESMDIIVEIIDPKHHDIVNSYSVNNVVISNRYISKMITQISEKESLFEFYSDILTYDEKADSSSDEIFDSKEIYIKKVTRFFDEIPGECTAEQLIRATFEASVDKVHDNMSIVLGYVKPGGKMVLFSGDQSQIKLKLEPKDKLILFSNH